MRETQNRWASGLILVAALWLIFSPLWVHYVVAGNAWQQIIVGIFVGLLALAQLAMTDESWPSWINFLAGIYLVVTPWVVNASTSVKWNQVILGIIVAALSAWSALTAPSVAEVDTRAGQPAAAGGFYERLNGRGRRR